MPTRFQGTKSEIRALNSYIKLIRAAETLTARITKHVADQTGLSISQFGVLEALFHIGPMCQKDIAAKQLKSGGNVTMVVDNLEKEVLVRRERSEQDRRMIMVHLTRKGRKLIGDYFPRHAKVIQHEMSALSAPEMEALGALARKLGLQKVGVYPSQCYK